MSSSKMIIDGNLNCYSYIYTYGYLAYPISVGVGKLLMSM